MPDVNVKDVETKKILIGVSNRPRLARARMTARSEVLHWRAYLCKTRHGYSWLCLPGGLRFSAAYHQHRERYPQNGRSQHNAPEHEDRAAFGESQITAGTRPDKSQDDACLVH